MSALDSFDSFTYLIVILSFSKSPRRYRRWVVISFSCPWKSLHMFRFISLGTHSFEGYVMAGMGTSVLLVLRFFMFKIDWRNL